MTNPQKEDWEKFLQDFHAYCHKDNPEGKTELVDYKSWAEKIRSEISKARQETMEEILAVIKSIPIPPHDETSDGINCIRVLEMNSRENMKRFHKYLWFISQVKSGKTAVVLSPNFVVIDWKTW